MQDWIINTMDLYGYAGIFLLIAVENIFPPIPSEIILTFGGFMTTFTRLNFWGVLFSATAGSLVGALALYLVGRFLSPERLERWLGGRIGRLLHFRRGDVTKACGWFEKRGMATVFFCRCIPIVRSLISIPAGMARMRTLPFLLLTTAGSLLWNTLLIWLGIAAGASWELIAGYFDTFSFVTLVVLAVIAAAVCLVFIKKRFFPGESAE